VVAANGALVVFFWFAVPAAADLLLRIHGALAFPAVLASWMYSDVPATNVLGGDARRTMAALADRSMLRRLLYAKNAVLWLLIVPLCVAVAIGVGLYQKRPLATLFTVLWIAVVPWGAVGVSAWLGIFFPYHPLSLVRRWALRRSRYSRRPWRSWWHMIIRWLILVLLPYAVVPTLTVLIIVPTLALWTVTTPHWLTRGIPDAQFVWGATLAAVVAIVVGVGATAVSARLITRRHDHLRAILSDPEWG
jgi:hypothetical protein